MRKKCKTEKNGKGKLNERDKYRKQVVKRWVREIIQNISLQWQYIIQYIIQYIYAAFILIY